MRARASIRRRRRLCTAPITVGREVCAREGWTLIEGSASWADPAGLVARADL